MQAQHVISVMRYVSGETDAHGNEVEAWSQPISVKVYSIAPTTTAEPFQAGREAVVTGLQVLAPKGTEIGPYDRVLVNGDEYTVEGDIADWSFGPFGWEPGISIQLERVKG